MQLDATNVAILRHIRDGRKSYSVIADDLAITENTVRSRVNRMQDEGLLEVCGLVDIDKLDNHQLVMVGVKLSSMELVARGEDIANRRGVVSVCVVTGRYDLILTVMLTKDFGLLEFYTEEISEIKGIQSVETFIVYKGYNAKVPYIM